MHRKPSLVVVYMQKIFFVSGNLLFLLLMKTMRTIAKGLSMLCLVGTVGVMLVLQLCSSNSGVFRAASSSNTAIDKTAQTSFSCGENDAAANVPVKGDQESNSTIPSDLGITRVLTPIISHYLSGLLPRLLH